MSFIDAARSLTGGGDGALDGIDGAILEDSGIAVVITDSLAYFYQLNATSGAAEDPPNVIAPDDNPGDKRWILVDVYGIVETFIGLTDTPANYTGSAGKYAKVNAGQTALEFDTPPNGFSSRCSVYTPSNQTIGSGSYTLINFSVELFDGDGEWNITTKRFTAGAAGYYHFNVQVDISLYNVSTGMACIYVNGTCVARGKDIAPGTVYQHALCSKLLYLAQNDYVEFKVYLIN